MSLLLLLLMREVHVAGHSACHNEEAADGEAGQGSQLTFWDCVRYLIEHAAAGYLVAM